MGNTAHIPGLPWYNFPHLMEVHDRIQRLGRKRTGRNQVRVMRRVDSFSPFTFLQTTLKVLSFLLVCVSTGRAQCTPTSVENILRQSRDLIGANSRMAALDCFRTVETRPEILAKAAPEIRAEFWYVSSNNLTSVLTQKEAMNMEGRSSFGKLLGPQVRRYIGEYTSLNDNQKKYLHVCTEDPEALWTLLDQFMALLPDTAKPDVVVLIPRLKQLSSLVLGKVTDKQKIAAQVNALARPAVLPLRNSENAMNPAK